MTTFECIVVFLVGTGMLCTWFYVVRWLLRMTEDDREWPRREREADEALIRSHKERWARERELEEKARETGEGV